MANVNMDALYPEFWFQAFDQMDEGIYNLQNLVSRDTESTLAKAGDTVNVPLVPDLGEADDWVPGAVITGTAVNQQTVPVVLNKSKKKTIGLTGKELSLSPYDLIQTYGVPMAQTIITAVNKSIYLECLKTNQVVDKVSGGIDEDAVIDAKTALTLNKVPLKGRILVCGPDDIGDMLKKDAFQYANYSGDAGQAMTEGLLQRKFGFDIFENSVIEKYTPADLTGAMVGNAIIGASTLVCDGFGDALNPIREGDKFLIAGDSVVKAVTATDVDTDGNTIGIDFYPPLLTQADNDDVITFVATKSALAMVRNAVAFAARSYAPLPGVQSSVFNYQNIPVRIVVWVDSSTLNVNVQYDILYGTKMVNPLRICRILSV